MTLELQKNPENIKLVFEMFGDFVSKIPVDM